MQTIRPRRVWAAGTIVVALVLAACGGSGGDTTTIAGSEPGAKAGEQGDMSSGMMSVLSSTEWEGMRIELASMAPTTFSLFQGDQVREVTPLPDDAMHLMAILSDGETGERIPYSDVWVTIRDSSGTVVFDERMWPMLSQAMGTHYGVNVELPAAGTYRAEFQITPPQAARHPEYADRWLGPTTVELTLEWDDTP